MVRIAAVSAVVPKLRHARAAAEVPAEAGLNEQEGALGSMATPVASP